MPQAVGNQTETPDLGGSEYRCYSCSKLLHTWEVRGRLHPYCKRCFDLYIRPSLSVLAKQVLVLQRMLDKYGLDRGAEAVAVYYLQRVSFLSAVRQLYPYSPQHKAHLAFLARIGGIRDAT